MGRNAFVFALVTAVLIAWLAASTLRWDAAVRDYESLFTADDESGQIASAIPGRIFLDNDAYYWVDYARAMVQQRQWRIRHTESDNPPDGRPVHWSQSIAWLIVLAGGAQSVLTGQPIHDALENGAIWVGPLLYFLLIVGTGYLIRRRIGLAAALLWMLNLSALPFVLWSFHPLRPDHHGLHLGILIASLLCLILGGLGWVRSDTTDRGMAPDKDSLRLPGPRAARNYFMASGVFGGLGIWTGATVQLFGVGLFAVSAFLLVYFMPTRLSAEPDAGRYVPSLWRIWAVSGSVTSLLLYLVEYAPAFPGMRLEVNHPLYALSWFCAGELLTRLSAMKTSRNPTRIAAIGLLGLGAACLPILLLWGPAEWHTLRDPLMQRVHEYIAEFRTYRETYAAAPWLTALKCFGVLPLLLVVAPLLADEKRTSLYEWAALWMAFLPALVYTGLTLWQIRWSNFASASLLLLALMVLAVLRREPDRAGRLRGMHLLIVALAAQAVYFTATQFRDTHWRNISSERVGEIITPMVQRQFASRLGALDTGGTFRVISAPHTAAHFQYYGSLPCVGSYYWENRDGLRATAAFFAAEDIEIARRIVRDRGITHIVMPARPEFVGMMYYVHSGERSERGAGRSMAARLITRPNDLPPWIRHNAELEKSLQPGYRFVDGTVFTTHRVFTIDPDALNVELD